MALTRAERKAADTKRVINELMLEVASDPALLCLVTARGPAEWRNYCARRYRTLAFNPVICDGIFRFFCLQVIAQFGARGQDFTPDDAPHVAGVMLDHLEVETPPTEAEVAAAWEVDSASRWSS